MSISLAELGEISKSKGAAPGWFSRVGRAERKMINAQTKYQKAQAKAAAQKQGLSPRTYLFGQSFTAGATKGISDEFKGLLDEQTAERARNVAHNAMKGATENLPETAQEMGTRSVAGARQGIEDAIAEYREKLPSNRRMAAYGLGGTAALSGAVTAPGAIARGYDRRKRQRHDRQMMGYQQQMFNSMNQPQWDRMSGRR